MSTTDGIGHRERLKEQFIRSGMDEMYPHHKLEMLLFYAIPRKDTKPIANRLLEKFGTLSGVFDADISQLLEVSGISTHSAILIKMIPQLAKAYMQDKVEEKPTITDAHQAGRYLLPKFLGEQIEKTFLICLNPKGTILFSDFIYEGSVASTEISARKIAEIAVKLGASSIIVSHNHPNTAPLPSRSDIVATDYIRQTLMQIGILLFDHIIVSDNDFISMAESGLIKPNVLY